MLPGTKFAAFMAGMTGMFMAGMTGMFMAGIVIGEDPAAGMPLAARGTTPGKPELYMFLSFLLHLKTIVLLYTRHLPQYSVLGNPAIGDSNSVILLVPGFAIHDVDLMNSGERTLSIASDMEYD